jgi:hypothetical protein
MEVQVMNTKRTLMGVAAACLLVGGVALQIQAMPLDKMPDNGYPKPIHLEARLASAFAGQAYGLVVYDAKEMGGYYVLDAKLTIPMRDFKVLEIDPQDGFDDESVTLTIGKDVVLKMMFAHVEPTGVTFIANQVGTGLLLQKGDIVAVDVNAKAAATGRF